MSCCEKSCGDCICPTCMNYICEHAACDGSSDDKELQLTLPDIEDCFTTECIYCIPEYCI